jgi:hypothetical protein
MINVNWSLFKDDDEYFEYYTNIHSLAASLIVYQGTSFPGNVTFSGSGFYTDGTNFIFTGLGTGAVASVFGRDGAVVAAAGDYAAFYATTNYATTLSNSYAAHRDSTGTNVHGLGTMALQGTGDYYTAAAADALLAAKSGTGTVATLQTDFTTHTNATGTNVHGLGTMSTAGTGSYYNTTAADALLLAKASTSQLAAVEAKADQGVTAYLWGDHADAGYLTSTNTRYDALDVADMDLISTNISGLTDGTYTGVVTSVAFTGAMDTVAGRFYVWGFTKQNNFGTGTLSAAGAERVVTAAGTSSNYFKALSADSNLVLRIDGDGSSKSDVSNVFVYEVTNGLMSAVAVRAKTASFEELILAAGGDLGLTGVDVRISDSTETNNPTTKSEVDTLLFGKASTVDLGTVSGMVVIANGNITTNAGNITTNAQNIGSVSNLVVGVSNDVEIIKTNYAQLPDFIVISNIAVGVSNDVEIIKTNYAQLPDFIVISNIAVGVSNDVEIIKTNYAQLPDFISVSNKAANSIQGVTIVTGATASVETNAGVVALTVPDPGASVSQWSAYEQTSLVHRVHRPTHESGWLTPYTNAWGAGWTDNGLGYTNEGSPLLYPEGDSTANLGQYLVNTMLAPSTSSAAAVSIATSNDTVLGVEVRIDSTCLYDVYASTGYAYFIVGSITSDVRVITNIPYFTTWGISYIGESNDLWGLSAENFIGETNIDVCVYVVSVESNTELYLDYLSANITYANEGFFGTNYFGYDATGKFVASDTGTNRYPLVELDALSSNIAAIPTPTNQIIDVAGVAYNITNSPAAADDILTFDPASTTAQFVAQLTPFQKFSATVEAVDGTATVTFAHGTLPEIHATNDTTITFDNTDYPTNGVNRVRIALFAYTNAIAYDGAVINTNGFTPTYNTNTVEDETALYFYRAVTNLWQGRY